MFDPATRALSGTLERRLADAVAEAVRGWEEMDGSARLWRGDATLWTAGDEADWMGWLDPGAGWTAAAQRLCTEFAEGLDNVVVLGMGGAVLGAETLVQNARLGEEGPDVLFLDSIDPDQVARLTAELDLRRCGFIVSSKSGTTLETRVLADIFWERSREASGREAGRRFLAVTDEDGALTQLAKERSWLGCVPGVGSIGGRYSVLSPFGLVALAVAGGDPSIVLAEAREMAKRCAAPGSALDNPGVSLGLILGAAAGCGFDKLVLGEPEPYRGIGDWIEQLVAESTGKDGKGILPVRQAAARRPRHLGIEWTSGETRLDGSPPTLELRLEDLGGELFRWQVATAVAGSLLGVNPFVQPGVESAKRRAREILAAPRVVVVPETAPVVEEQRLRLWVADSLAGQAPGGVGPVEWLRCLLDSVPPAGFLALLAWMDRGGAAAAGIERQASMLRERAGLATSVGFGPRYLHSTGQLFKAGPRDGGFLFITHAAGPNTPVPGRDFDLATLAAAQARADFEVLSEQGRPAVLVRLEGDLAAALERLEACLSQALEAR